MKKIRQLFWEFAYTMLPGIAFAVLIAVVCLWNGDRMPKAEAQTARPASSKTLSAYQWTLTSLSGCVSSPCYPQAGGANDTADMYLGTILGQNTNSGVPSAGFVTIGASAATISFIDGNGVTWNQSAFAGTTTGSTSYQISAGLMGAYFAKGLSITCSGGGCAGASMQVYYQR